MIENHFVFLQKICILHVWQSSECASAMLWKVIGFRENSVFSLLGLGCSLSYEKVLNKVLRKLFFLNSYFTNRLLNFRSLKSIMLNNTNRSECKLFV